MNWPLLLSVWENYFYDDWETTDPLFSYLIRLWDPYTVDRFADNCNAKVQHFKLLAFEYFESRRFFNMLGNNYLVPPVYLLPKVIKHLRVSKTQGTLIVPNWSSATL